MLILLIALGLSCVDVDIPVTPSLFPTDRSFILSGTAAVIDQDGPCLVWLGENGETFHLFQDPRIANDDFDRITAPGVTSRLEVSVRTDLFVACEVGTIVEVTDILEIGA